MIQFWPEKGPLGVQLYWLELGGGGVALTIGDSLQPPRHRLHEVPQVLDVTHPLHQIAVIFRFKSFSVEALESRSCTFIQAQTFSMEFRWELLPNQSISVMCSLSLNQACGGGDATFCRKCVVTCCLINNTASHPG